MSVIFHWPFTSSDTYSNRLSETLFEGGRLFFSKARCTEYESTDTLKRLRGSSKLKREQKQKQKQWSGHLFYLNRMDMDPPFEKTLAIAFFCFAVEAREESSMLF
jgi:hypothetical protein